MFSISSPRRHQATWFERCAFDNEWTWRDGFQTLPRRSKPLQNRDRTRCCGLGGVLKALRIAPRRARLAQFQSKRDGFQTLCNGGSSETTVNDLVSDYLAGSSIDSLASGFGVSRTTIISHLDHRGVTRRKVVRKMTNRSVARAAKRYLSGESLKAVAARFGVDTRTLAREFGRAGVSIRPRRGWPPACQT
jgi:hypothetical protein